MMLRWTIWERADHSAWPARSTGDVGMCTRPHCAWTLCSVMFIREGVPAAFGSGLRQFVS